MKKFILITLGILTLMTATQTSADVLSFASNYTPARPSTEFKENIQGFSYPSFNNFTKNPNISVGGRQGDERAFTTAKYCEGGSCCNAVANPNNNKCYFYDTLALANLKENDVIRFEVYFHNNGNDSYDEFSNETSPDATNIKVGVDLTDYSANSNEPELMIRPKGFIYSDNGEYRTNKSDPSTVIKDNQGNVIRTATDDIQAFLDSKDLYLVPTDSMAIAMRKVNADGKDWDIEKDKSEDYWEYAMFGFLKGPMKTTFQIPNTTNLVTVTTKPVITDKKMWLEFDRLPGCFRYSGTAYFDVKIAKRPPKPEEPKPEEPLPLMCKASTLDVSDLNTNEKVTKLGDSTYLMNMTFFEDSAKTKTISPSKTKVTWTSTDNSAGFYELTEFATSKISRFSGHPSPYEGSQNVIYSGKGQVNGKLSKLEGKAYSAQECAKNIDSIPNKCATLNLNSSVANPKVGDTVDLTLSGKDIFGKDLPNETKVYYQTTTGGNLEDSNAKGSSITSLFNKTVTFSDTKTSGNVKVTIDSSDPLSSNLCLASLDIKEKPEVPVEEPLECNSLQTTLKKYSTQEKVTKLEPNSIYEISATTQYSKEYPSSVNLEIDPNYGRIISVTTTNFFINPVTIAINGLKYTENLTPSILESYLGAAIPKTEYKDLQEGNAVYIVLFSTLEIDKENILKVYESVLQDEKCTDYFSFKAPEKPVPPIPPEPPVPPTPPEIEIPPTFSKFVYPENKWQDADNLINISDKTSYLTYALGIETGTSKTLKVKEEAFANGNIRGDKKGSLRYENIRINITEKNGNKYTILKTPGYKDDQEDKNYELFGNKSIEDFESFFNCDTTTNYQYLCLKGNFKGAIQRLQSGQPIEFANLGKETSIRIKIQVKNNTIINANSCQNLKAVDGCGEEFNNTATYTTDKYTGSESSNVIAVCPYVLSRQGGDTFFHDVIDTGIDVARCAPVKSSTGPTITPTPKAVRGLTKTGTEDKQTNILLKLPTHDICKYSNTETNIENYNNVLENFSSTICELRAEVAENWKLTNIVEKMQANVTRLSRWGNNLTISKLSSQNDLSNIKNNQSGVFVKENGDLTIGENGEFTVEKNRNIPAAQTYIIKNGNLHIKNNIKYGLTNYSSQKTIPSVAFIVLDGNIIIDNKVSQLDGIYMAVDLSPTDKNKTGKTSNAVTFNSNSTTENLLTINGNLIGNVNELFATRVGVGNPKKDEGSITVKYDQRILFNTPPGLNELISINQSLVP